MLPAPTSFRIHGFPRPPPLPGAAGGVASELQYVYQDPGASLDPRWKIRRSLHEPLIVHTRLGASERDEAVKGGRGGPPAGGISTSIPTS